VQHPELADLPVTDCHVHYGHPGFGNGLIEIMDRLRISRLNVVCTPDGRRLSLVPDALHLKAHHPERVYVFGGLDVSALLLTPKEAGRRFSSYVETLVAMGCDGVKMIEGKPAVRKLLPIPPFDGEVYAPYWQKLADSETPLLFHVNDPEEFWDAALVPGWARAQGWFYGDGSYIDNERQYSEVLEVLRRHPNLRVIFAHFFFLSAQLPRLAEYLDRFPNLCVDLTPGVEMYESFSAAPDVAREFFLRYQDRILYGTDIGAQALVASPEAGIEAEESRARVRLVRSFLESEGEFELESAGGLLLGDPQTRFRGIGLPEGVLRKIYGGNFERIAGSRPRALDPEAIAGECERLAGMIDLVSDALPGGPGDPSIARMVQAFFESKRN
jgi:predicted TIM-barrel fold metal-dependent hydrolase